MSSINHKDITYIVSDLHLAEGNLGQGRSLGTENFFSGLEFSEFIDHLICKHEVDGHIANLTINGDFVDFIRITEIPKEEIDFKNWQNELDKVNSGITVDANRVDKREKSYGLKTNDYKSVWKLYVAIKGHSQVFESLAHWVALGNSITIVIGNHDPEWYWPLVQEYFKDKLYELRPSLDNFQQLEKSAFVNHFSFYDQGYSPHPEIWIEHGHNYEKMTKICPKYELNLCTGNFLKRKAKKNISDRDKELFLPIGSFFNRYLINKVEIIFPFADNLTTNKALFGALFNEDFKNAGKILWNFGGYTVKVILKHFWKSIFEALIYFAVTVLPIALALWMSYRNISSDEQFISGLPSWVSKILESLSSVAPLLLRYIFKYLLRLFNISDKPLPEAAFIDMKSGGRLNQYSCVFLGHNHTPELIHNDKEGKTYVNTGTWTSKYVFKYKQIQSGNKYAVGCIQHPVNEQPKIDLLQWKAEKNILIPLTSFKTNL